MHFALHFPPTCCRCFLPAHSCSPACVQAHYRDHGKLQFARSLLVLHNMAHQGRAPVEELSWLELPEAYAPLFRWVGAPARMV